MRAAAHHRPPRLCYADPVPMTRTQRIAAIRRGLLRWYARHGRDLPWRGSGDPDPYAVWVSEVMLQQTQVATVEAYWRRFLRRFPTVRALARARLDAVLKAWEGLGYYGRARNLHAAARQVVAERGGRLPTTAADLAKLPGIGRYTAGAITSIAFGADEAVLDGNVTRVLCRTFAVAADPKTAPTREKLWSLARNLIRAGRAGAVNQAAMDLGATVCLPRGPKCDACPLRRACRAHGSGRQETYPRKSPRKAVPHYDVVAGVVRRRGRILIGRRRPEGLLGGLWEFPGGKVEPGEMHADALAREVREETGVVVRVGRPIATVRHAYSHFRITLRAFACQAVAGRARPIGCDAVKWVRPADLTRYAFPAANAKVLAALRAT